MYGKGKLTSVTDPSGTLTYAYNAPGMVIQETRVTDGQTYITTYFYDSTTGDLSSMTYPGGLALMYGRDADGRVDEIASGAAAVVRDVKYMPFGPVREMTFGDGVLTASVTYNERYLPTRIQAGPVMDYQYTEYTGSGEVKTVTGVPLPDLTAGNTVCTPASDSNRMTGYTYDGAGNIISDGTRTFVYNQRGRLARVLEGETVLAEYEYDAFGRRVKKIAGGATTFFHYDPDGLLIAETGADGSPLKYYVWLNGQPAAMKVAGAEGAWYYFLNDHLGTPQKLVNGSGNTAWEAAYLPFGGVQISKADVENNLRFPGQYYDAETGLHYNWHRYYDPATGRYITADPIGLEGGDNVYAYCLNDPVNRIDPEGENTIAIGGEIGFSLGGPVGAAVGAIIGAGVGIWITHEMAARGNQADTQIVQAYGEYASEEKLNCKQPKDRCEWLKENQHLFNKDAVKATAKDWGCKHSRVDKDKKR